MPVASISVVVAILAVTVLFFSAWARIFFSTSSSLSAATAAPEKTSPTTNAQQSLAVFIGSSFNEVSPEMSRIDLPGHAAGHTGVL